MPKVERSVVVDTDADTVWQLIRDFNGLSSWIPGGPVGVIEDGLLSDQVGCVRRFGDGDDAPRERLVTLDDVTRSYRYTLLSGPFKVRDYLAVMRVTPVHDGGAPRCLVEWNNAYDCDPADEAALDTTFGKIFGPALDALRARFAG